MWRALLGLVLLAAVLWKAGSSSVLAALGHTDLHLFVLALLLYGGCQLLSSLRWSLLLRGLGATVQLSRLFALYLVGMFFNQVLPGSISGDVARISALRTPEGAVSVFLDRLLGLLALLALAASFGVLRAGALLLALSVAALFIFWRVRWRWPPLSRAQSALRALPPRSLAMPLLASAVVQLGNWLVYLVLARSLGITTAGAGEVLAFYVTTTLAAVVPISLGGLGVREAVGAAVFAEVGLPAGDAVALALLWTASATLWSLGGGILFATRRSLFGHEARPA